MLFWINELFHCIIQARLSDGSSVTVLIDEETIDPGIYICNNMHVVLYYIHDYTRTLLVHAFCNHITFSMVAQKCHIPA